MFKNVSILYIHYMYMYVCVCVCVCVCVYIYIYICVCVCVCVCVCIVYTRTHVLSSSMAQQLTLSPGLFNNLPPGIGIIWLITWGEGWWFRKMDHGYQELYKVVKLERGKIGLNQSLL